MPIRTTVPQCHHIKDDGIRCGSPALRGKALCYFHLRQRRLRPTLHIPILEDKHAIQFAVTQVLRAALEDRMDHRRLRTMLYALQVATMNLRNCERSGSNPDVREPRRQQVRVARPSSAADLPQQVRVARPSSAADLPPSAGPKDTAPGLNPGATQQVCESAGESPASTSEEVRTTSH